MIKQMLLAAFIILAASAQAQYGSLSGKVVDGNGEGFMKAKVTALANSGASVEVLADNDGNYEFKNLSPGTYSIQFSCTGFISQLQTAVHIAADRQTWLNVTMQPDPNYVVTKKIKSKVKKRS